MLFNRGVVVVVFASSRRNNSNWELRLLEILKGVGNKNKQATGRDAKCEVYKDLYRNLCVSYD